jgi:LPS-assembly protein
VGLFHAAAEARFDPLLTRFTRVSASASFGDARRALSVGWEDLLDEGTARSRQPIDLLFGSSALASATSRAQLFVAGGRYVIGDFSLRYELQLLNKAWPLPDGTSVRPLTLTQHTLGVAWTPACDCWRVEVTAIQRPDATGTYLFPEIGGSVTVTRFGSIGTGGASGQ